MSVGTGEYKERWENNRRCKTGKCHMHLTITYYWNLETWAIWWSVCTVNENCYFCIRWWEILLSFMLVFGGRIVALPPSPCILTREAARRLLEGSTVPSDAWLAVRKGGETRKGEQYLLPASKTHLCSWMDWGLFWFDSQLLVHVACQCSITALQEC